MVVKWRICNVSINNSTPNELQPHLENPLIFIKENKNFIKNKLLSIVQIPGYAPEYLD